MVLENYSVQNSPRMYFGSPMSSDSNALNSYTFNVTYILKDFENASPRLNSLFHKP